MSLATKPPSFNSLIQNARHEQTFHLQRFDVQFIGNETNCDSGVRTDQFDQHLRSDVSQQIFANGKYFQFDWIVNAIRFILPSMCSRMNGSAMMFERLFRKIDSNSLISLFWYDTTKFVMARISGSFLYGLASCESNGLIPDFINL